VTRRRRWAWLLGLAVTLGAAGIAVARVASSAPPLDASLVVPVQRGTLGIEILETGRVEPREQVELKSKLAGEVVEVRVDEGDRVHKGDLLVLLDPTDYERELAGVEAELGKARAAIDFARLTLAYKRRAVSERVMPRVELDAAEHALRASQAEQRVLEVRLSAARDRVRYTRIVAPMDGTVIQRGIEVGEVVVPGVQATFEGKPLLTVADLSVLRVQVDLNQIDVAKVRLGGPASVTFDALPGKTYAAEITRVAPASSRLPGKDLEVFAIEAELLDADVAIKPGMTADVRIRLEERQAVLTVPIEAVLKSEGRARVIRVLGDGRGEPPTEQVEVTLGARNDREQELLSGVNEGDRVLIDPASASANELPL
jgi:HlyD family secretion protein/macrolide-specific efflux system membrane fusion protein